MDESTRFGRFAGRIRCLSALIAAIMAGCANCPVAGFQSLTEVEIAVLELRQEWLKECEGVAPVAPDNSTGSLLEDYVEVSEKLAQCMTMQRGLSGYMAQVYEKARQKRLNANQN